MPTRPKITDERLHEIAQWMKDQGKSLYAAQKHFMHDWDCLKRGMIRIGEYEVKERPKVEPGASRQRMMVTKCPVTGWDITRNNKYQSRSLI